MTDPVRIAFVGTGGIAGAHLKALDQMGEAVRIVALCDVVEDRARGAAQAHGGQAFADHRRMLDAVGDELDAVYVCVPPFAHGTVEIDAAARGLHLFVEKPVVLDLEQGLRTLAAIEGAGVLSSVGYTLRHRHPWRTVRDVVHDAGLQVSMVASDRWGGMPGDEDHWWRDEGKSGGQLHEQTTHQVDAMRWTAGDITEVHARYGRRVAAGVPKMTIPDAQVVDLQFASGAVGYVSNVCSLTRGGGRNGLQVICGDLLLDVGRDLTVHPEGAVELPDPAPDYESIDAAFVRAVATGDAGAILCDYAEGLKSAAVSIAANESARTGKPAAVWGQA